MNFLVKNPPTYETSIKINKYKFIIRSYKESKNINGSKISKLETTINLGETPKNTSEERIKQIEDYISNIKYSHPIDYSTELEIREFHDTDVEKVDSELRKIFEL